MLFIDVTSFLRSIHQAQLSHVHVLFSRYQIEVEFHVTFNYHQFLEERRFSFQSLLQDGRFTLICFIVDQLLLMFLSQRRNAPADSI